MENEEVLVCEKSGLVAEDCWCNYHQEQGRIAWHKVLKELQLVCKHTGDIRDCEDCRAEGLW